MTAPTLLRAEHLVDPLGTHSRRPRLSWRLPPGSGAQLAYEVELDGEALGPVTSDRSVLTPWPGPDLASRQRVEWRVRVRTDAGESDWSAPATIELGLCDPDDWGAGWIEPVETERYPAGERPGYHLRRTFEVARLGRARLYATARGVYECHLNGHRVGDLELTPGFTAYDKVLQVQAYDVTDLLEAGANTWEVVLSDGWFRGRNGFNQVPDCYGRTVAFLGQLEVDGAPVAVSDGEWEWSLGPITAADLMAGQTEDRRRAPSAWAPVTAADHPMDALTDSPAPPVRAVEEITPVAVRRLDAHRQIVDLGQNINGRVRLHDLGPADTVTTLVHGEALDADGDVTQSHLDARNFVDQSILPVGMTDRVTSAGTPGDVFEPRHTVHGFQFVRIEGHPHDLTPDDVTGVVVHTDLRRTGWFRCSDERVDRFHEATVWSFRDNACDIPTDCPQRERAGWTGDYQLFLPTAAFLFDVAGFSEKWLRDLRADARPDGCVCNFAPDPVRPLATVHADEIWRFIQGSSGWGDAITIVPWELYRAYGDEQILADCWPAMVAWVDYAAGVAAEQRHPDRQRRSPEPAPHERFVWDGGWHWGEWLEPGLHPDEDGAYHAKDKGDVGTAFLHRSASLAARIGRMLGHGGEADRFAELAAQAKDAWRREFIDDDGRLSPDTQANHVRALAFGLVPDELTAGAVDRLVGLIRAAGTHLGTGFLATPDLLPVLADHGYLDLAYELLLQDSEPSWLTMIDRGATTVWETWNGIDADGVPHESLNHYSKGAVVHFLHTHTAGIRLLDDEPAYRRFRVEPRPGGGLTHAEAEHESPYGRIRSAWTIDGDRFSLSVTVPPGTTAEVVLPDGTTTVEGPGDSHHSCVVG